MGEGKGESPPEGVCQGKGGRIPEGRADWARPGHGPTRSRKWTRDTYTTSSTSIVDAEISQRCISIGIATEKRGQEKKKGEDDNRRELARGEKKKKKIRG